MAKSFIKNAKKTKHAPDQSDVANIAEMAHQYVQNWTRVEAQKMVKDELLILPTKDGMQVGKYSVKHMNKMWHVYNVFNELIDAFTCKQSAVAYSLLDQTNKINTARDLLRQDTRISKLEQDQTNYVFRRTKAIKSKDTLTIDMLDARITEAESLLNLAREDLEKTLIKAKYLKGIWE
jgi:predicted metal-dependent hydrolase